MRLFVDITCGDAQIPSFDDQLGNAGVHPKNVNGTLRFHSARAT